MRRSAYGFTLVELLTVLAIIAVLATLLMTSLATAKKKSRQTVCTGNLRQISLALNMYLDDFPKRPSGFESLASDKYLPSPNSFICPEDKTRKWGALVQPKAPLNLDFAGSAPPVAGPTPPVAASASAELLYSYLHPLPWDDSAWAILAEQGSSAGIAACQLHGLGKQDVDNPRIYNFEGLVLRAQRDTAVVRRHVYWDRPDSDEARTDRFMALPTADAAIADYPWRFFTDHPPVNDANAVKQP